MKEAISRRIQYKNETALPQPPAADPVREALPRRAAFFANGCQCATSSRSHVAVLSCVRRKSRPGLCFQHNRAGPRLQRTKFEAVRFFEKAGLLRHVLPGRRSDFQFCDFVKKRCASTGKRLGSLLFPHREHRRHAFQTARFFFSWRCVFDFFWGGGAAPPPRGGGRTR